MRLATALVARGEAGALRALEDVFARRPALRGVLKREYAAAAAAAADTEPTFEARARRWLACLSRDPENELLLLGLGACARAADRPLEARAAFNAAAARGCDAAAEAARRLNAELVERALAEQRRYSTLLALRDGAREP